MSIVKDKIEEVKLNAESYGRLGIGIAVTTAGIAAIVAAPSFLSVVAGTVVLDMAQDKIFHDKGYLDRCEKHAKKKHKKHE